LIGGAGLLFTISFIWSQSSLHLEEVRNITRHQEGGRRATDEQMQAARLQLLQMMDINPWNPSIHEELGLLYTQIAERLEPGSKEKDVLYLLSLSAFEQATQLQPADATSWANIIWVKAYLKQYDQTLFNAMDSALAAAPWRPYPVSSIVEVGLLLWPILPQASRLVVVSAFNRALILVPEQAKTWGKKGTLQQSLCNYSGEFDALLEYCKIEKTAPFIQK